MDSGQITAIVIASIIGGTISIGAIAQAWFGARARQESGATEVLPKRLDVLEERLYRLEQAIDAVALEVERGSEAQRFTAKLLAERLETGHAEAVASRITQR